MPKDKVIDWAEARNQVGGDEDFLNEVLQDLLTESRTAQQEIEAGIKAENFEAIKNAAHRIKGSASYLYCEALREVSFQLQEAGHKGSNGRSESEKDRIMSHIRDLFEEFEVALSELRKEIASNK
jgi:HPt (histidine-containing phosphotransfer) domain-containing protein